MNYILLEHSSGIYIFTDKYAIFSHLPLSVKQNAEHISFLNNSKLHPDLLALLCQLPKNAQIVVDKSLNAAIKKACLSPVNDNEKTREARTILAKMKDESKGDNFYRCTVGLAHLISREKVQYDIKKEDNFIIQTYEMIELLKSDIDKYEKKLFEMYGYHFPELKVMCTKEEYPIILTYVLDSTKDLDSKLKDLKHYIIDNKTDASKAGVSFCDDYRAEALFNYTIDDFMVGLKQKALLSIGTKIADIDLVNIKDTAELLIKKYNDIKLLKVYLNERLNLLSPNLNNLLGPKLTVKLITKAGGLQNLAKCASSTLQLLGAEKALFRALKSKSNTPKYGVLYEFVRNIDDAYKSKIARFLSAKCSLAARIDCFGNDKTGIYGTEMLNYVNDKLKSLKNNTKIENTDEVLKRAIKKINELKENQIEESVADENVCGAGENVCGAGENVCDANKTKPMKKDKPKTKVKEESKVKSKSKDAEAKSKGVKEESKAKSKSKDDDKVKTKGTKEESKPKSKDVKDSNPKSKSAKEESKTNSKEVKEELKDKSKSKKGDKAKLKGESKSKGKEDPKTKTKEKNADDKKSDSKKRKNLDDSKSAKNVDASKKRKITKK